MTNKQMNEVTAILINWEKSLLEHKWSDGKAALPKSAREITDAIKEALGVKA